MHEGNGKATLGTSDKTLHLSLQYSLENWTTTMSEQNLASWRTLVVYRRPGWRHLVICCWLWLSLEPGNPDGWRLIFVARQHAIMSSGSSIVLDWLIEKLTRGISDESASKWSEEDLAVSAGDKFKFLIGQIPGGSSNKHTILSNGKAQGNVLCHTQWLNCVKQLEFPSSCAESKRTRKAFRCEGNQHHSTADLWFEGTPQADICGVPWTAKKNCVLSERSPIFCRCLASANCAANSRQGRSGQVPREHETATAYNTRVCFWSAFIWSCVRKNKTHTSIVIDRLIFAVNFDCQQAATRQDIQEFSERKVDAEYCHVENLGKNWPADATQGLSPLFPILASSIGTGIQVTLRVALPLETVLISEN